LIAVFASLGVERVREMPFEKGRKGRERLFIVVDPEEPLTPKISGRDFWVYDVAVSGEVCSPAQTWKTVFDKSSRPCTLLFLWRAPLPRASFPS
jgi:hypothetical protein